MDKKVQWSLAGAAWILVLGLLGLGWVAIHRFGADPGASPAPGDLPPPSGSEARPLCPVDKVEADPGSPLKLNYKGRLYHFCANRDAEGRDHRVVFLSDPGLYLYGKSDLEAGGLTPLPSPVSAPGKP